MPKQYWYCPNCRGNFDPDEKCDCKEAISINMDDIVVTNNIIAHDLVGFKKGYIAELTK